MAEILHIQNHTYNLTTLSRPPLNLTYYPSNRTISNGSTCYLLYPPYLPNFYSNGTLTATTSCFDPANDIRLRGILGIVFGLVFTTLLFFSVLSLNRLSPVPRQRVQYEHPYSSRLVCFWQILTNLVALLSTFVSLDVDRYPVLGLPMVLQSVFFACIPSLLLATVFEAFKHRPTLSDKFLEIFFYTVDVISFVFLVPHSWSAVQLQRSVQQEHAIAKPAMTNWRMKAGTCVAGATFLIVLLALPFRQKRTPLRASAASFISITSLLIFIAYNIISSWIWTISPYRHHTDIAILYCLGYTPPIIILTILNLSFYLSHRHREAHPTPPPPILGMRRYWTRSAARRKTKALDIHDDFAMTNLQIFNIIARNNREANDSSRGSSWWPRSTRSMHHANENNDDTSSRYADSQSLLARDSGSVITTTTTATTTATRSRGQDESPARSTVSEAVSSSRNGIAARSPQVVRSMLDI